MSRLAVRDDFLCLMFTHKQKPIQAALLPTPDPLPAVPLVEPLPEPEAVEERPYPVRHHRQRFNFKSWLKDLFHINRLGTVNPLRMSPGLLSRGDEVKTTTTKG